MSTERFDIRHAPAPRESFRLLYISKSKFGGDWNSTAHTHSCTELFYCLSGEGQFYLSGQLYPVKPDDMIIVNPQVEHTELSLNAAPLEYIVLGVAGIEILFGKSDSSYAIFNCRENRERMVTLLHMLPNLLLLMYSSRKDSRGAGAWRISNRSVLINGSF